MNKTTEALESQEQDYEKRGLEFENEHLNKELDAATYLLNKSQEQEPVAWMGNYSNTSSLAFQKEALKDAKEIIPLYIHPAQPSESVLRRPLSDDEILQLSDLGELDEAVIEFARAIEQAHGIGVKKC